MCRSRQRQGGGDSRDAMRRSFNSVRQRYVEAFPFWTNFDGLSPSHILSSTHRTFYASRHFTCWQPPNGRTTGRPGTSMLSLRMPSPRLPGSSTDREDVRRCPVGSSASRSIPCPCPPGLQPQWSSTACQSSRSIWAMILQIVQL